MARRARSTDYAALLSAAQAGEADLGNLVNGTYTSAITGSARLLVYPVGHGAPAAHAADVVLPLSAGASGGAVALSTTASTLARSFTLPPNIERAYLDVIAQSQSGDESGTPASPTTWPARCSRAAAAAFARSK